MALEPIAKPDMITDRGGDVVVVFHSRVVVIEALGYKWLRCSLPARLEVDEKHLNFTHRITLGTISLSSAGAGVVIRF